MDKDISNYYINKIIEDVLFDKKYGSGSKTATIVSNILDGKDIIPKHESIIKTSRGEISRISHALRKVKESNNLKNIKDLLNQIVKKLKRLIEYITLFGNKEDKLTIKDLNDSLVRYMIEEEEFNNKYKQYLDIISELGKIESDFRKFKEGDFLDLSKFSRRILTFLGQSVLYFFHYMSEEEKDRISNLKTIFEDIQDGKYDHFQRNSGENSSNNSRNKNTNLSFSEALSIMGLTQGDLTKNSLTLAYRRKASTFHPDKNPGKDTNKEMSLLNQARNILLKFLERK